MHGAEPYIIQRGTRKAVISTGGRVQLLKVRPRNKKRPVESPVWPESPSPDPWHTALTWVKNCSIDFGETEPQQH